MLHSATSFASASLLLIVMVAEEFRCVGSTSMHSARHRTRFAVANRPHLVRRVRRQIVQSESEISPLVQALNRMRPRPLPHPPATPPPETGPTTELWRPDFTSFVFGEQEKHYEGYRNHPPRPSKGVGGPLTFFNSVLRDFKRPPDNAFTSIIRPKKNWNPLYNWRQSHLPPWKRDNDVYMAPTFPGPVRLQPEIGYTGFNADLLLGDAIPFLLCQRFSIRIPIMPIWMKTQYHYQLCPQGPEDLPVVVFPATQLRE